MRHTTLTWLASNFGPSISYPSCLHRYETTPTKSLCIKASHQVVASGRTTSPGILQTILPAGPETRPNTKSFRESRSRLSHRWTLCCCNHQPSHRSPTTRSHLISSLKRGRLRVPILLPPPIFQRFPGAQGRDIPQGSIEGRVWSFFVDNSDIDSSSFVGIGRCRVPNSGDPRKGSIACRRKQSRSRGLSILPTPHWASQLLNADARSDVSGLILPQSVG